MKKEQKPVTIDDFRAHDAAEDAAYAAKQEKIDGCRAEIAKLQKAKEQAFLDSDREQFKKLTEMREKCLQELPFLEAEPVEIPEGPTKEEAAEALLAYTMEYNAKQRETVAAYEESLRAALCVLDQIAEHRNAALRDVNYLARKAGIPEAEAQFRMENVDIRLDAKMYRARKLMTAADDIFYGHVLLNNYHMPNRKGQTLAAVRMMSAARDVMLQQPVRRTS